MRISVVVHHPRSAHALGFVRAALNAGHEVPIVFFYHDGVLAGQTAPPAEQLAEWIELHQTRALRLCACVGAASRRGLVGDDGRRDEGCGLDDHFEIVGLGQLVGAAMESDRVITFPA